MTDKGIVKMQTKYKLQRLDLIVLTALAAAYFILLRYLHHDISNTLISCNDDFFNADTAEVYEQIGGFYLNLDTMKHTIPYALLFLLEKIRMTLPGVQEVLTRQDIFLLIASLNVCLAYVITKVTTNNYISSLLIAILFGLSFSQLTVGSFPETYGITIFCLLSYLAFYNICSKSIKKNDFILRVMGSAFLGLCHLPLVLVGLYSHNHQQNSFLTKSSLIVLSGAIFATSPMWSVSLISPSAAALIYDYTGNNASINNFLEFENWLNVINNLYVVGLWNPAQIVQEIYAVTDTGYFAILVFVIVIGLICRLTAKLDVYRRAQALSVLLISVGQICFYIFFAPDYSALFAVTAIAIVIPLMALIIKDFNLSHKSLVLGMIIFIGYTNSITMLATPSEPIDGNCYNWGVKQGLMRVF
jgi:hypothetical protein